MNFVLDVISYIPSDQNVLNYIFKDVGELINIGRATHVIIVDDVITVQLLSIGMHIDTVIYIYIYIGLLCEKAR